MPALALATCAPPPEGDDDRPLLDGACQRAGVSVVWAAWNDPSVDWSRFDAVLIHSTWDYHASPEAFLSWVGHVDEVSRLHNPALVVSWNAHKRYLADLDAWGVPVVPTAIVERTNPESLATVADRHGWTELVVKPAVSAGAKSTGRHHRDDPAGERALSAVLDDSDGLVQPYLDEIETLGETSLIVIDGEVTHAVAKTPATGDFRVQPQFGGADRAVAPTSAERELARAALDAVSRLGPVLYARVDCLTVDGQPRVMEFEAIEPALYLAFDSGEAADRLITAFAARTAAHQ